MNKISVKKIFEYFLHLLFIYIKISDFNKSIYIELLYIVIHNRYIVYMDYIRNIHIMDYI